MRNVLRFLLAFLTAFVLMMVVRTIGITIYTIDGSGLEPLFQAGDRVMVNRWSYGLRVGGKDGLFDYGRIIRQAVGKGDMVAFENPRSPDQVLICRCTALPGDTVISNGQTVVVPSLKNCADRDYYWMESDSLTLGFIAEEYIIGRVFMVVYSHDPEARPWTGWRPDRILLPI